MNKAFAWLIIAHYNQKLGNGIFLIHIILVLTQMQWSMIHAQILVYQTTVTKLCINIVTRQGRPCAFSVMKAMSWLERSLLTVSQDTPLSGTAHPLFAKVWGNAPTHKKGCILNKYAIICSVFIFSTVAYEELLEDHKLEGNPVP